VVKWSAVLALWEALASYLVPETGYIDWDYFFGLPNLYKESPGRFEK
jgi:hypothetical protein